MFDIKSGMRVKLANDLSKSIRKYGGSNAKRQMQGTYQEVYMNFSDSVTIKMKSGTWTILKSEIVEPSIEPVKIEPELFNPENLI